MSIHKWIHYDEYLNDSCNVKCTSLEDRLSKKGGFDVLLAIFFWEITTCLTRRWYKIIFFTSQKLL